MAAVIMTGRIIYSWIFSADRAALSFTEAEVAFLFQAPVQRRVLVHYKLLKSQIRILFSAALFALVSRRLGFLGGNGWMHAIGWWILLSTLELHSIAASFTRERLLEVGLNPARRRALFLRRSSAGRGALWWWLRRTIPRPPGRRHGWTNGNGELFQGVLTAPPVSWLLAPCIWILRPFFAPDLAAFIRALGPALLILAGHYLWVIRSEVAFEEASLELARRRAERGEARQAGHWRERSQPRRKRREPFPLRPHGMAAPAFLWRALISADPGFIPATGCSSRRVSSAPCSGSRLSRRTGRPWWSSKPSLCRWVLGADRGSDAHAPGSPLDDANGFDVVKTYPLRGWQVVLGEMLAPIVLITAIEWLLLAVLAVAAAALNGEIGFIVLSSGLGVVGVGLLVPSVVGLMTGISLRSSLVFSILDVGGGPGRRRPRCHGTADDVRRWLRRSAGGRLAAGSARRRRTVSHRFMDGWRPSRRAGSGGRCGQLDSVR